MVKDDVTRSALLSTSLYIFAYDKSKEGGNWSYWNLPYEVFRLGLG